MKEHPAGIYNNIKNITLSLYHSKGIKEASKYLDSQASRLGRAWYGLKAELLFYHNYRNQFILDPVNDYGIKCDFTGDIDGVSHCRIDVTTNIDFKKLATYDPIMSKDNRKYKIVVVDYNTGNLQELFDLNFPCDRSGEGKLFDIALFMPADFDNEGCSKYNYYQKIITLGSSNPYEDVKVVDDCFSDWYLPDIATHISEMPDDFDAKKYDQEIAEYLASSAKVISKSTERNIVACAQCFSRIYDEHDDEEYYTKFYWKHPVIADYLDDELDFDLSEVF